MYPVTACGLYSVYDTWLSSSLTTLSCSYTTRWQLDWASKYTNLSNAINTGRCLSCVHGSSVIQGTQLLQELMASQYIKQVVHFHLPKHYSTQTFRGIPALNLSFCCTAEGFSIQVRDNPSAV